MKNIKIGSGVTSVGDYAFRSCRDLTEITIPSSVKSVGESAFKDCGKLNKVNIDDISAWCETEFENIDSNPLRFARKLYLNGTLVTKADIPYPTSKIGQYAFYNCNSLASVTIPDSVTSIGKMAFDYTQLINNQESEDFVYVGKFLYKVNENSRTITDANIADGTIGIADQAFAGCEKLKSVTFPDTLKYIGEYAFSECGLTSVIIPDSVLTVGNRAFDRCWALTSVTIGESVRKIGPGTFDFCTEIKTLIIGNSVTEICRGAFIYCEKLATVTIPDSVTSIGEDAFNKERLTAIYGNKGTVAEVYALENGIAFIAVYEYDLKDETGIEITHYKGKGGKVKISSSIEGHTVTSIGDNAFKNYRSLTDVTIPDSVTNIGENAFNGCSRLTSLMIGDNVTSIGENAFSGCTGLTSVTIPDSVITIGDAAFSDCNENLIIIGKKGSAAETYCSREGITFRPITSALIGDTDRDGKITISDVTEIQKYLAEFVQFTGEQLTLADTNGDGKIDIGDATHLQKYLAEFDGIVLGKQN